MEIKLPFAGFYESAWSDAVDRVQDNHVESLAEEYDIAASDVDHLFYFNTKYQKVFQAIAEAYVPAFQTWLEDVYGIVVTLRFAGLDSPKEYNFTTDRVFASISYEDVLKLLRAATWEAVAKEAEAQFKSRDGFISFYPSDISRWGKVRTWDHNQLGAILDALVGDSFDSWALVEAMDSDIDQAFDKAVDWRHIEHACQCLAEGREDDWDEFPRGITDPKAYADAYVGIHKLT